MKIRARELDALQRKLRRSPVVALLGARQVGKSTLAKQLAATGGESHRFDLENPRDLARLEDPLGALESLTGLVVLDEIQLRPELFPVLRVLADRERDVRFLVLGSASPELLRQSSETLAGRIAFHMLDGFSLEDVLPAELDTLWLRGGFPRSFLAESDRDSRDWREDFIRTFLERDLPQLGIRTPAGTMHRFWRMLAHYHGQTWNASELGRALGTTNKTVASYLDQLVSTFAVTRLEPWYENAGKRLVRSPKVYLRDAGMLHALLGIETRNDLLGHPKVGASFEGFGVQHIVRQLRARDSECFFWGTQGGAELDLLVVQGKQRRGFEFKCTTAPRTTKSMHAALADLNLDQLDVVHLGDDSFTLKPKIRALSIRRLGEL